MRKARISVWEPDWRSHSGGVEVSDGALLIVPRTLQEDILIYDQDMGRRWAMWALLGTESGRVHARLEAPRLSSRMFVDTIDWPELFRFALSPNGQHLAVSAHDRVWVFDLTRGETVWEERGFSGAGGLAFSPDGEALAVLDRALGGLQIFSTRGFQRMLRGHGPREATGLLWLSEGLLAISQEATAFIPHGATKVESSSVLECDNGSPSLDALPGRGEIWLYCPGTRTGLQRLNHLNPTQQVATYWLQGERKAGSFAVAPSGNWMVIPAQRHQAEGMCLYDVSQHEEGRCFGQMPLRQAQFDADGNNLYGIDQRGRAWKWRLSDLLGASEEAP